MAEPGSITVFVMAIARAFASCWSWIGAANLGLAVPYALTMIEHWSGLTRSAASSAVAFAAALVFAWRRRRAVRPAPPHRPRAGLVVLAAAIPAYVASVALDVRVGTGLCFTLAVAAQVYLYAGGDALRTLLYPLVLLALAAPAPGFLVDALSTRLLDLLLVVSPWIVAPLVGPTRVEGYHLHLQGGVLPVIEDCSGVGTLLVFVPLVAILVHVHRHRSAGRLALLVLGALPLAFAGNLLRVVVSAVLLAAGSPLAKSAFAHEMLANACLLLSMAAVFWLSHALGGRR